MEKYVNEGTISALVLAAAIGYGVAHYNTSSNTTSSSQKPIPVPSDGLPGSFDASEVSAAATSNKKSGAKKRKTAKGKSTAAAVSSGNGLDVGAGIVEPTISEMSASSATPKSKGNKNKKGKGKKVAGDDTLRPPVPETIQRRTSEDDDGEWTTVESSIMKHKIQKSGTEEPEPTESPLSTPQKTLAEKMLPKPRKTGVDDMTESPDYPTVARVMRVTQPEELSSKPSLPSSSGGLETSISSDFNSDDPSSLQVDDDDDGWESIPVRSSIKSRGAGPNNNPHANAPKKATASETMTKKQRQNAARREREKSEKAASEQERLATLKKHKRDLEKVRMDEQWNTSRTKSKVSGGMQATVDASGRLVWD